MDLREELVAELRKRARMGESPCTLAGLIGKRLGMKGRSYRIQAIAYFQEAFGLELPDAMRIGAAPVFEEGGRDTESLDAELTRLMNDSRARWDPSYGR